MADYKVMRSACAEARGGRIAERSGVKRHGSVPHAHTGTNGKHHGKPAGYADGGAIEGGAAKKRADKHKGAVNVTIVMPPAQGPRPMPIPMPARPAVPPVGGPPMGMPPPGAMPPRPMPPGAPMGARPPGMKRGGGVGTHPVAPPKMDAGAGSGLGRIEKSRAQAREMRMDD